MEVLASFALVVLAVVVTVAALAVLPGEWWVAYDWPLVLLGVLTVAFLPLYHLPSRVTDSLSGALPGAIVAAVGWTFLLGGIQFYAVNAGRYAIYGVLSGVVLILTSLYLAALILMIGVVVNAALAGRDLGPG